MKRFWKCWSLLFFMMMGNSISVQAQSVFETDSFFVDQVFIMPEDIRFDYSKAILLPSSFPYLDSLAHFLKERPQLKMEIGCHNDSRGSDKYSYRLDAARAKSVKQYLIDHGVPEKQLEAKGYGETQLLITDAQIEKMKTQEEKEAAHATNRRIELKVLEVSKR